MGRRLAAVAAVGGLAVFGVAACGSTSDAGSGNTSTTSSSTAGGGQSSSSDAPAKDVTLTFWDHSGNATRAEVYKAIVKDFEAANPHIHVDFLTLPSDSAFEKIQVSISSGTGPDILGMSGTFLAPLTQQDALLRIDDQFAASPLADQIDPSLLDVMRNDAADGGLYALPYTFTAGVLWYRTELWSAAGYPDGPASWADFYDGVRKLTKPDKGQFGFAMRGGAGSTFQFLQAMYAQSGVDKLWNDDGTSTVNDPANVEALTKYAGLYKTATSEADLNYGYPDMVAAFDGGSAATLQHNLGSYGEHVKAFEKDQFAAVPLMEAANGKRVVIADPVPSFAIFKSTQHPAEAWKFMEFLMNAENNDRLNESIGQVPSNTAARDATWLKDSQSVSAVSDWIADDKAVVLAAPTFLPDYGTIMRNDMEPEIQRLLLGQSSPQDFLDKWAGLLSDANKEYQEANK
jgi:multiple sugar transport system substrate-binding protein